MNWISKLAVVGVSMGLLALGAAEIYHHQVFGHFVAFELHTDVILGNSDIGADDMYYAWLWNLSFQPFDIKGCVWPSDVGGVPDSVSYRWDVQKWDLQNQRWMNLRDADTWVRTPLNGSMGLEYCKPVLTRIRPFQRRMVAWVYKDWVKTGEPVRMAIYTSANLPPINQRIVYTDLFVVKVPASKKP